jgi:uncharacterized protein YndB with AHSA1/START domain
MVRLHVQRTIAAPQERVFAWLSGPASLTAARLLLSAGYRADSPSPGVGAVREVTGIGVWLREEITAYDPPRSYSYRILRSFPAIVHEGGTMTFTSCYSGTHVDWVTTFSHPLRAGGAAMEAVTSRVFRRGFAEILDGCAVAVGTPWH